MRPVLIKAGRAFVPAERVPTLLARAIYPPTEDRGRLSPVIGRVNAEEEHAKAARRAAIQGELPVFDHAGLPTVWSPRARVRVADFIDYAARFEVSVAVARGGADARASSFDPKAAPIDWVAYRFRDGFTLFELACLLNRLDPRAVSDDAHQAIRSRGGAAAEVLNSPAATAEMLYLCPENYFFPPVGATLERLKRAAGSRLGLSVNAAMARGLVAMLGLPYPPELEREAPAPAIAERPADASRWTPERLEELRAYRAEHGTKKAAEWAAVSPARVRALLPGDKSQPKGYSAFNPRVK